MPTAELPPELRVPPPRPLPGGAATWVRTAGVLAAIAAGMALGVASVSYGMTVRRECAAPPRPAHVVAVRGTEHGLSVDLTYVDGEGEHAATSAAPAGAPYAPGQDTQVVLADFPPRRHVLLAETLEGWRRNGRIALWLGAFYALLGLVGGILVAARDSGRRYLLTRGSPTSGELLALDRSALRGRFLRATYRYDAGGVTREGHTLVDQRRFRDLAKRPAIGDVVYVVYDPFRPEVSALWGFGKAYRR